ncbi:hypothetical protein GCM10010344_40100 [Streptomyces bluensis]|nr:hypothetical protein GCM10010344_40100 [Streptomyces bluensis]
MFEPFDGAGHGGRVRAEEPDEVGLALRAQVPQLHHHQLLPGVESDAAQELAGQPDRATSFGGDHRGYTDYPPLG